MGQFQKMWKDLKLPEANELVLKQNDKKPEWTISNFIDKELKNEITKAEARNLSLDIMLDMVKLSIMS
jgi:hypothetical protein